MKVETASFAHQGGRDEQQDAHAMLENGDEHLVIVADGMGGHAGGRIASSQLIETARRVWDAHRAKPFEPRQLLDRIIREGHAAINEAGAAAGLVPRSTAAVLYLGRSRAHWAHVGDSRIYRFRDGAFRERTRDHSVVQMLVDLGKVAEEEMGAHPDQNRLTQSLGGESQPMPDFGVDDLKAGDSFLLCSDGLWEMVPTGEMQEALARPLTGNGLAAELTERAFDRAGARSDNITVAMVRVDGVPVRRAAPPPPPPPRRYAATESNSAHGRVWAIAMVLVLVLGAAAAVFRPWQQDSSKPPQPAASTPADATSPRPETTTPIGPRTEPVPVPKPETPPQSAGPSPPAAPDQGAAPPSAVEKKGEGQAPETPPSPPAPANPGGPMPQQ